MSPRRYHPAQTGTWSLLLALLLNACQPTPAALTGPALVVLGPALPGAALPPAIRFRPDSTLAGTPDLYLYVHPGSAADTATVPWLHRLSALPTAPWQVEYARHGRLRGQPLRYVREQRLLPWPYETVLYQGAAPRWQLFRISLAYPQLPPGLGPAGINARLREDSYDAHRHKLYVWLEPQPAYDSLPLLRRRPLTDTVLLYCRQPVQVGLLRLPGGRELLSLLEEEQTCPANAPTYTAALYESELDSDDVRRVFAVKPEQLFRTALGHLLTQAVLQLMQDTRRRHHWPPLLPAQCTEFHRRFDAYRQATFTPHGLLVNYYSSDRYYNPLAEVLPPSAAQPLTLLVPYQVLGSYLRPKP